jgi:hypothetical protein
MVMTGRADLRQAEGAFEFGSNGHYRLALGPSGAPATLVGPAGPLALVDAGGPGSGTTAPGAAVTSTDAPLRWLIQLQRQSGHPVLLTEDGAFAGVCGPDEVIRALSGGHGAAKQAHAAN